MSEEILGLDEEVPSEYTLKFDDKEYTLTEKMVSHSGFLTGMIELDKNIKELCIEPELKKFTNDSSIIGYIVEFLELESNNEYTNIKKPLPKNYFMKDSNPFNKFINSKSIPQLKTLLHIADYMIIDSLVDLGCAKMAEQLQNKTKTEIDEIFKDIR